MTTEEFWAIVESLEWGTKTTKYEEIKRGLLHRLTPEQANALREVFASLKSALYKKLDPVVTAGGDDSFDDLLSHIIGLGRAEYEAVMADPSLGAKRAAAYDYTESFCYALPYADDFEELDTATHVDRALRTHAVYDAVAHADDDTLPWLPKLRPSIALIQETMAEYATTQNKSAVLSKHAELTAAAKLVAEYVGRIVPMMDFDHPLRDATHWAIVDNFCHDLEYLP